MPTAQGSQPSPRERLCALDVPARWALGVGAAALVGAAGYGLDLALSAGDVPRGTTVAGVDIGGRSPAEAAAELESRLGGRINEPIHLRAEDVVITAAPSDLGLTIDWAATVAAAGGQPLNPWTRLASHFRDRPVFPVGTHDTAALSAAVTALPAQIDRAPVEGDVVFDGTTPRAVHPRPGLKLRADATAAAIRDHWLDDGGVALPVDVEAVSVSREAVDRALDDIARPAVSAPITIAGDNGASASLSPAAIAGILDFVPDGAGLRAAWPVDQLRAAARPGLAATERPAVDARVRIVNGRPEVVPGHSGHVIDWEGATAGLTTAARAADAADRRVTVSYRDENPTITTEMARDAGITEVIGEFTTSGYSYASGVNIQRVAEEVDQAFIPAGGTFSLNRHTGPRGTAQGYVSSGVIIGGRIGSAVGGGISQFATTLYNAAYFAGFELVEYQAHSFYISRYPAGREATVYEGSIDLVFRNNQPTAAVIETVFGGGSITVRIWGTKHVDVESIPGARRDYTSPQVQTVPAASCAPSGGSTGFTTSDTRVIRERGGGRELAREERVTVYQPEPAVRCEAPPAPAPDAPEGEGRPAGEAGDEARPGGPGATGATGGGNTAGEAGGGAAGGNAPAEG